MTFLHPDLDYQKFLGEGHFMIQRCRDSGRHVFYPRIAEPVTGSTNLEWVEASGRAEVYAVTVVRQRPPAANYNVVVVDLAEGPRMMSRVDGIAPEDVKIGMTVQARVITEDGQALVVFHPVFS
jgi:uncharacterized OB-fold protein